MDSNGEAEQLFINQAIKLPTLQCDLINECQMFVRAEEGGGDAHSNMQRAATPDSYEHEMYASGPYIPSAIYMKYREQFMEREAIAERRWNEEHENDLPEIDELENEGLPSTVTILKGPAGGKVYLVGTAHFSLESQEDVSKVIRHVKPHIVVVELCEQRTNILLLDEEVILKEAKNINFDKIRSTIAQSGLFNGLMYILLLDMSAHITRELGMAPGGEFRRAMAEAKMIPNCVVQLGDRSIDITLQRAIASLSWRQTIKFIWHLLTSNKTISVEEVEKCKQKKMLEDMLEEMSEEFPPLKRVFVVERDKYLCHSLQVASTQLCGEPCRVVGIVGIGHVAGIQENWGKIKPKDIGPLLVIPRPTLTTRLIRVSARVACVGALVYAGYKLFPRRWLP